jgi:hypothetical protein
MKPKYKTLKYIAFIIIYLFAIDLSVGYFVNNIKSNFTQIQNLQRYFDYGRSTESKFDIMIKRDYTQEPSFLNWCWIKDNRKYDTINSAKIESDKVTVTVYGMSHTKLLGNAIEKLSSRYYIKDITAPGAPANWSFASFLQQEKKFHSDIAILGIMTDIVSLVSTSCGATLNVDMAYPFTYPRFTVKNDSLLCVEPPVSTLKQFYSFYNDNEKWSLYRHWLSINDKYFDQITYCRSITDGSILLKLIKRAYSISSRKNKMEKVYRQGIGFNEKSEEVIILKHIIKEFSEIARNQGTVPIVYIVNNPGGNDFLFKILFPTLTMYNIPYLSTHRICPTNNPSLFLHENRHFIPSKDIELAGEMIKIIDKELDMVGNVK